MQQTTANVDQIRDIENRVQSLSEVLTSSEGEQDKEEKARRKALRRFVLAPWRDTCISLSLVCCPQEVGWDHRKTQTALRTTWDYEILQER